MPYCIYTDAEVPDGAGNFDHIVPLSLWGLDGFWTWSDKGFNSNVGSKIDGAIANDPLVMLARRNTDARGHSKRPPLPVWKRSTVDGKRAQIKLAIDSISGWDPIGRKDIPSDELEGRGITSTFKIDRFAPMRFAAKVALGTAYFAYGDAIRQATNCDDLRKLIALRPQQARLDPALIPEGLLVCDRYHPDANGASGDGSMYRALCEFAGRTTVILVPYDDAIAFHVGVCGMFMASITAPADTTGLPKEGPYDLGYVILLGPGKRDHVSLRSLALMLNEQMAATGPDAPA